MSFLSSKAWIAIWSAVLQWARVGMNATVFLVLTRWLSLSEIGVVAAVQAPIIVAQSLVTTMFPEFIVQERFVSDRRLSSVFWLSALLGVLISLGLVLASPLIVGRIHDTNAKTYLLVLAACPFLWAIASVSEGLHRRALDTRKLALRTVTSSGVAAVIAISAGYAGWGGWAIVLFTLVNTLITSVVTIFSHQWRPRRIISFKYLRVRRSRMQALMGRHILGAATMPVMQFAVAVQLGTADAGIFQVAVRVFTLVESIVMTPYRFVVMPLFAMAKKGTDQLATLANKAVSMGCLIAAPAYCGLIAVAPSLMPLMLGEKNGPPCVLTVQLLSLNGVLGASSLVVNQILVARGYAAVVFRRSLLLYALSIAPAVMATVYSVQAVAFVYGAIGGSVSLLVSWFFAKKYIGVNVLQVASTWARVTVAGALLSSLLLVYLLIPGKQYLFQFVLVVAFAPIIYVSTLFFSAKNELIALVGVLRARR